MIETPKPVTKWALVLVCAGAACGRIGYEMDDTSPAMGVGAGGLMGSSSGVGGVGSPPPATGGGSSTGSGGWLGMATTTTITGSTTAGGGAIGTGGGGAAGATGGAVSGGGASGKGGGASGMGGTSSGMGGKAAGTGGGGAAGTTGGGASGTGGAGGSGSSTDAGGPLNDRCESMIMVSAGQSFSGTTCGATNDADPPCTTSLSCPVCAPSGTPDVFLVLTGSATGDYSWTISAGFSSFAVKTATNGKLSCSSGFGNSYCSATLTSASGFSNGLELGIERTAGGCGSFTFSVMSP
jgi:hypothetical protein